MIVAGLFGGLLFLALVLGDWFHFTSLTGQASGYGCGIARAVDRLPSVPLSAALSRFGGSGVLQLPNGIARVFADERRILVRPQYRLLSRRFRTAWPMKGTLELAPDGEDTRVTCIKRIPWSSAILTLLWFLLVGIGTITFVIAYLVDGGLSSLGGLLMGMGILALGLLVLTFGLVTVVFAYRLENDRFTQVYRELLTLLTAT